MGYAERAGGVGAASVLDPLYATASFLQEVPGTADSGVPGTSVLLLSLDICVLETPVAEEYRKQLAQCLALPVEAVWLCCSHTHSGPHPQLARTSREFTSGIPQLGGPEPLPCQLEYGSWLGTQLVQVALMAKSRMRPVTMAWRNLSLELGYNRRVPQPDGGVKHCWNPAEFPDRLPQPAADNTVSLVEFSAVDSDDKVLWVSAAVHPVVLGKGSQVISADWPGAMRARLEQCTPNLTVQFFHGASGEIHPWQATQADPAAVQRVGDAFAFPIHLARTVLEPIGAVRPEYTAQGFAVKIEVPGTTGSGSKIEVPGTPENEVPGTVGNGAQFLRLKRVVLTSAGRDIEIQVARLGPLTLIALPFEWFASASAVLRQRCQAPLFLTTVTNGWEAYWPDANAFAQGGYEVTIAWHFGRTPDDNDRLLELLLTIIS